MTVWEILYKLVLGPIELLFDVIFAVSMRMARSPVLSIIVLSLAINLLVLPLYKKADDLQQEENEIAKRLKPRVDQIREAFTGDERFMILQTYYRQNHYKPYYVLRGSLSLLLQIPFFMAAYNFLSNLSVLQGVSFGPIADLAAPDGMLKIAGITVNVLPILMTGINIVSGMIYTRGMPLKSKIQLYGMALVFLVLLYDSPAGLVFYWTLNNIFSLGKNIFNKLPDPKKALRIGCSVLGLTAAAVTAVLFAKIGSRRAVILFALAALLQLPMIVYWLGKRLRKNGKARPRGIPEGAAKHQKGIFFASCILLTILTGILIPSAVINASPAEFVEIEAFRSPLVFVFHAFLLAAGLFLIWCVIFYLLAEEKKRPRFALVFAVLAVAALVNYMFFGNGYGNMSSTFVYDVNVTLNITNAQKLLNAGVILLLAGAVWFLWRKKAAALRIGCVLMCLVTAGMSAVNIISTAGQLPEIRRLADQNQGDKDQMIHLDRKGRNVIVFMLDRAIGYYAPFIFEEKPELKEQFRGFTCYLNTLSYGHNTKTGSPALFGGYEYTPEKMDQRSDTLLKDKQNEALRLMPLIFLDNGFEVTVCDPPMANYHWIPDLSIYDDVPEIRTFLTEGKFFDESSFDAEKRNLTRERNAFCHSIFRIAPVLLQSGLYDSGKYNKTVPVMSLGDNNFTSQYTVMKNLSAVTRVQDEGRNDFLMMANSLTHEPVLLQEPAYELADPVDNAAYDAAHPVRTAADGRELDVTSTEERQKSYQTNVAALQCVGEWLDTLREQGVYDNTRIILAADHGSNLDYEALEVPGVGNIMAYNPLFMVKDFDSREEFTFSDEFMTQSDTPTLAFAGLVENPVNPATGVPVTDEDKQKDTQWVCSTYAEIGANEGTAFRDAKYYAVKNHDILNPANWVTGDRHR